MKTTTLSYTKPTPTEPIKNTKMLTPKDISEILSISYESALAFIKNSGIDYVLVGRQYRVSEEKLKRFLSKSGSIFVSLG